MLRLEKHLDGTRLSFQEEHALRWLIDSAGRSSNVGAAVSCAFVVDDDLLRQCLLAAVVAHDALRTRFMARGPHDFMRLVRHAEECGVDFVQRHLAAPLADPAIAEAVATFCDKPFLFEDRHWFRALLIHTRDGASVLALSMPHVVSDATSMQLLVAGIWRDYVALGQGDTPRVHAPRFGLADFAASQRAWGETADFKGKLDQLAGEVAQGIACARRELPDAYADSSLPVRASAAVTCRLSEPLCEGLRRLALHTRASLPSVMLAGAVLATARLFQRRQFCFRLPFANRLAAGSENIVGFLANDIPVFWPLDETQSFRTLIRTVQTRTFAAMRFGAVPWAVLKQQLLQQPVFQGMRSPFEDHVINVFPALAILAAGTPYEARPFPIRALGFTSNELKVWMQLVNNRIALSLRVGIEEAELAERYYLPYFLQVFAEMVMTPDGRASIATGHPRGADRTSLPA